jgi:hypothetical protein
VLKYCEIRYILNIEERLELCYWMLPISEVGGKEITREKQRDPVSRLEL